MDTGSHVAEGVGGVRRDGKDAFLPGERHVRLHTRGRQRYQVHVVYDVPCVSGSGLTTGREVPDEHLDGDIRRRNRRVGDRREDRDPRCAGSRNHPGCTGRGLVPRNGRRRRGARRCQGGRRGRAGGLVAGGTHASGCEEEHPHNGQGRYQDDQGFHGGHWSITMINVTPETGWKKKRNGLDGYCTTKSPVICWGWTSQRKK